MFNKGLYLPCRGTITGIEETAKDTRLFTVEAENPSVCQPGQFVQVSVLGAGEVPVSVSYSSSSGDLIELCIRRAGSVTSALHRLSKGDEIGLRGPYGTPFPVEGSRGMDLVFVAGGIGIAPLRSVIRYVLERRKDYGKITLLYGARSEQDIVFKDEMRSWSRAADFTLRMTLDHPPQGWEEDTGVVTGLFCYLEIPVRGRVFICGPQIMMDFSVKALLDRSVPADRIYLTLERNMKCGVGKCGHCYMEDRYVCTDGPVFCYESIKERI